METQLAAQFKADGILPDDVSFQRIGDLRYVGQGYELKIPIPAGKLTPAAMDGVFAAFHTAHAAEYGHAFQASPIEIVNVRVSGIGQMPKLTKLKPPTRAARSKEAHVRTGPSRVPRRRRARRASRHRSTSACRLPVGETHRRPGHRPAERHHHRRVTPGATAIVHPPGSILITLGEAS